MNEEENPRRDIEADRAGAPLPLYDRSLFAGLKLDALLANSVKPDTAGACGAKGVEVYEGRIRFLKAPDFREANSPEPARSTSAIRPKPGACKYANEVTVGQAGTTFSASVRPERLILVAVPWRNW